MGHYKVDVKVKLVKIAETREGKTFRGETELGVYVVEPSVTSPGKMAITYDSSVGPLMHFEFSSDRAARKAVNLHATQEAWKAHEKKIANEAAGLDHRSS